MVLGRARGRDPLRRRDLGRGRRLSGDTGRLQWRRLTRPAGIGARAGGGPALARRAHPGWSGGSRARGGAGRARADAAPLPAVVRVLDTRRLDRDTRGRSLRHRAHAHRGLRRVRARDHAGGCVGVAAAAGVRRGREPRPHAGGLGGHARGDHGGVGTRSAAAVAPPLGGGRLCELLRGRGVRARDKPVGTESFQLPAHRRARGATDDGRRRRACAAGARLRVDRPQRRSRTGARARDLRRPRRRASRRARAAGARDRAAFRRRAGWGRRRELVAQRLPRGPVPARHVRRDGRAQRDVRDGDHVGAVSVLPSARECGGRGGARGGGRQARSGGAHDDALYARLSGRAGGVFHRHRTGTAPRRGRAVGRDQARGLGRRDRGGRDDHPPPRRRPRPPALVRRAASRSLRAGARWREGGGGSRGDHEPRRARRSLAMRIAVLGPGGVGGLLAAVLERDGQEVAVVATDGTAAAIAARGLRVSSVRFGDFVTHPPALTELAEKGAVLIVATKAAGLRAALERVESAPRLVLPLLNGLDHLAVLRERFRPGSVLAGSIRVESDRPEPGVVVHTSPFLLVNMASSNGAVREPIHALAAILNAADVPTRVLDSEADVMWSKLVRLNALACTTSAYDELLGEIRSTPQLRADLVAAIEEACAVGRAEGAHDVDPARALAELDAAHATLGSSMQRDIAAGREPELDAIPGAVLRAAARDGIRCPTIARLTAVIAARAGIPMPAVSAPGAPAGARRPTDASAL